ncbi:unnamed protein product [Mytilus edulis]|uniref:KAP NTPase domain-containing protein n=1 Tax=Mytilus edulis TaxID=6550 RepID=A0A8S3QHE6_MYTED|nr:unnamed protein product [Mytilus edulis]
MDEDESHEENSVGDLIYERDEEDGHCYERKQELLQDCKRLTENVRKPLNVAIIGPPGCGKSSFLNTVFASLNSDRWYEYAKIGKFGNHEGVMGMQVTRRLRSNNRRTLIPCLIWKSERKESLNDIATYGRLHGITKMKEEYRSWKRFPNRRINRIIIVCSLNPDSAMPTALFKSVVNVANELDITFYGVMTHADICREKYGNRLQEREKLFREYLGLPENRLASVINYCPAVDPDRSYEDTLLPALDVPVLKLLRQVI